MPTTTDGAPRSSARGSVAVATGILASRVLGLVRQRAMSHYLGLSTEAADAFAAGFRIPNLLQNLFGEGALSASFIPVYAGLLAQNRRQEADRVAGAVGAWLALGVALFSAAGVLAAHWLVALLSPGFEGEKRALTVTVVRILFPGAGLLVLSAWCLGVLNSHRRFLLSYAAPVVWNVVMISALLYYGPRVALPRLVAIVAWASVVGSALQGAVQLPVVLKVAPGVRPRLERFGDVEAVGHNFVPAFFSRGVVQISASVDTIIASWLPTGVTAALQNAQTLYTLPVSLFGLAVSAAELPAMAGDLARKEARLEALAARLNRAAERVAFFVVPSAVAFAGLGDVIVAGLLQSGRFTAADARFVWAMLAGAAVGLLASTLARLYASASFALRDTRTPLRCALVRVFFTTVLGWLAALVLPRWLGLDPAWGGVGLTASAGVAGWIELWLLRAAIRRRVGPTGIPVARLARLWGAAAAAAVLSRAMLWQLPLLPPVLTAVLVLPFYAAVGLGLALALDVPEAHQLWGRVRSFVR